MKDLVLFLFSQNFKICTHYTNLYIYTPIVRTKVLDATTKKKHLKQRLFRKSLFLILPNQIKTIHFFLTKTTSMRRSKKSSILLQRLKSFQELVILKYITYFPKKQTCMRYQLNEQLQVFFNYFFRRILSAKIRLHNSIPTLKMLNKKKRKSEK